MNEVGPSRKKVRTNDSEESFGFEEELAFFHSMEQDVSVTRSSQWSRPDPPQISAGRDKVIFQQIDIDHYIGEPLEGMPGARNGPVPIVRMYGVTMEGNSVCAHVHGFLPYFYVPAPSESFTNEHCDTFRRTLNDAVLGDMRSNKDGITQAVYAVELYRKCSMFGFHFNKLFPFLKVTVATPKLVPATRRILNNVSIPPFGSVSYQSFESNIDFEVRFMVDTGIVGCNWIECPAGMLTFLLANYSGDVPRVSRSIPGAWLYDACHSEHIHIVSKWRPTSSEQPNTLKKSCGLQHIIQSEILSSLFYYTLLV